MKSFVKTCHWLFHLEVAKRKFVEFGGLCRSMYRKVFNCFIGLGFRRRVCERIKIVLGKTQTAFSMHFAIWQTRIWKCNCSKKTARKVVLHLLFLLLLILTDPTDCEYIPYMYTFLIHCFYCIGVFFHSFLLMYPSSCYILQRCFYVFI